MEMRARILNTETDRTAWVEAIMETSSCHSCASSSDKSDSSGGCGVNNIGRMFTGNAPQPFRVIDPIGCKRGDEVVIEVADGSVLRSAAAVYLLPLTLVFIGAILAARFAPPGLADIASVAGAGFGLLLGAVWLWRFNLRIRHDPRFQPVILRTTHSNFFMLKA